MLPALDKHKKLVLSLRFFVRGLRLASAVNRLSNQSQNIK
jgi:hypothetical protein